MRQGYVILGIALLVFGCLVQATRISDLRENPDKYLGESVTIKGTVDGSVKIGSLSGFRVDDGTGKIGVKSDSLPPDGSNVTVTGTLAQDTIFGYYIQAKDVSWQK